MQRGRRRKQRLNSSCRWLCTAALLTSLDRSVAAATGEDWDVCRAAGITIEDSLSAEWHTAVLELCKEYRSMPDLDAGADVHFSQVQHQMLISVWLRDGRHAQRRILSPAALRGALEALVVVPPAQAPSEGSEVRPYGIASSIASGKSNITSGEPSSEPPGGLRIEIAAGAAGRMSRSPRYLSVGATTGAAGRWGHWLFGLNLRFEPWTRVSAGYLPRFEMSTAGLGFMLGRGMFASPSLLFDAAVTTTLLSEAQSVQLSEREVSSTAGDVRVGALARCLFGSAPLRLTVTLDGDVSPARAGRSIRAADALPPLPSWSLGLGLGLSWLEP